MLLQRDSMVQIRTCLRFVIGDDPYRPRSCLRCKKQPEIFGCRRQVLLVDGHVKCFGDNDNGKLGTGSSMAIRETCISLCHFTMLPITPSQIQQSAVTLPSIFLGTKQQHRHHHSLAGDGSKHSGLDTASMGEELDAVSLGAGRRAVMIAAGWEHTCALLDDR
eukprot:2382827-Rhodomonas_salina.1